MGYGPYPDDCSVVRTLHYLRYKREESFKKEMAVGLTKCASPGVDTTFFSAVEGADDFPGTKVIAK